MKQKKHAVAKNPRQPADGESGFPIVGIGASAGGLKAFEEFFSGMPADRDPGMAFVLVQHLAPDHESILCDLIRRYTRMQVFEVEDGMVVRPNCAYIIPPGRNMAFLNGALHLLDPIELRGLRLPIDFFFRSLAQDQRERAIGIVLSGTASDGSLGVRAIKGEGGMAMAQSPGTAEFDGMPRSAIATGLVDFELPPAEMPARLIAYAAHAFGRPAYPGTIATPRDESAMKKVIALLRSQTGHDFSQYKPSSIHRRIERRMADQQIDGLDNYVRFLQGTPAEAEALFRDLLIGVTSFFRDPEAFQVLEDQAVRRIFEGKPANALVRAWSAGCSTGEEAYSLAILLVERMEELKRSFTAQVFATDIDSRAIALARAGFYPASIAADVTPERLARFFTAEPGGYRIHKAIREMIVFSEQDLIKDPPFSKLDLICCRNLLIYFDADLQKRLLPVFRYALNPGGFLFLGTSERVNDCEDYFAALDGKSKVYQRKGDVPGELRAALPASPATAIKPPSPVRPAAPVAFLRKQPLRKLAEQGLLQHVVAVGALVNGEGDILYIQGRTGMYLELAAGQADTNNILKMAREGLRNELAVALHKAARGKEVVIQHGVRVKTNDHFTTVNLTIRPQPPDAAATPEPTLYLVIIEEASSDTSDTSDAGIAALRQELCARDEYIQSTREQLETSNEELKSSNEEMQSVNEELQSSNEELETAKEEMQSVNEELATVNNELQTRLSDLARSNNDMNNLLAGTGIGTVFVDMRQSILRFTPAATEIINLRPGDTGRPVAHIATNLIGYDSLVADVEGVMETLIPREEDVQTKAGGWYRLRIQPYRTLENVIEGAVLTFVNITEVKRAEAQLTVSNEELAHFNRLMAGRELRMIELKQEVNDLAAQLGRPQPHQLAFLDAASSEVLRTTPKPTDPDGANFTERNTKE